MNKLVCNRQLLQSLGWHSGDGFFLKCRICHRRSHWQEGWYSPNYAFYHDSCLYRSNRYAQIVKRANKACTRPPQAEGTHTDIQSGGG